MVMGIYMLVAWKDVVVDMPWFARNDNGLMVKQMLMGWLSRGGLWGVRTHKN